MAESTEEQFNEKVVEVFGNLGVAIGALAAPNRNADTIRPLWETLGRSFAELMEMR
jgi:hypothetical protein